MTVKYTYYKGRLACQYRIDKSPLATDKHTFPFQGKFNLEPRFRLFDAEEITETDYEDIRAASRNNWIKTAEVNGVELYWANNRDNSNILKVEAEEIFLQVDPMQTVFTVQESNFKTLPLDNYLQMHADPDRFHETQLPFHQSFYTYNDKETNGKIAGLGILKVPVVQTPFPSLTKTKLEPTKTEGDFNRFGKEPKGCFRPSQWPVFFSKQKGFFDGAPGSGSQGCFSGRGPLTGCFGPGSGTGGCFGIPMNSLGCLPMLGLLLLLSLIAGLLGRNGCTNPAPAPVIIRDTVRVEVKKTDTLKIIQKDTVSIVDSTTSIKYETVSLPNVQFVTNSDVLLPSSASDLQQLAEYLIRNDSLKATIYGHTDSVGNPAENMKLSQRRAESVKRFLSSLGVDPSRMEAIGKGDTEPRASNALEEGRLMNRRVEVKLVKTTFQDTRRTIKESPPKLKNDPE